MKAIKPLKLSAAAIIRRLLISWLAAALLQYLLLDGAQRGLSGLSSVAAMSFVWLIAELVLFFAALTVTALFVPSEKAERWSLVVLLGAYILLSLKSSFTVFYAVGCALLLLLALLYAVKGMDGDAERSARPRKERAPIAVGLTILLVLIFSAVNAVWLVCRVKCYSVFTYDFGIFAQMFESMRKTGLPDTTLERDGLLSHFKVHVSPVYYLYLPFYALVPKPETLQILQVLTAASAVIPLWLIARRRGLSPLPTALLCGVLLAYPAYSAGMSYDLHENVFLTPLLLWLFYAVEIRKSWAVALFSVLTLSVKEDAAVYVAVLALWLLLRTMLREKGKRAWGLLHGGAMLLVALVWFLLVTGYLSEHGDGVMTYRYQNFIFDGTDSLLTVVKTVLLNPLKLLYECSERYEFFLQVMMPLLFLPFLTRRYERFLLLIPLVLLNLMPDYAYQHDITCQYTFGTAAFLFYMATCNLAELPLGKKPQFGRGLILFAALCIGAGMTVNILGGQWRSVTTRYLEQRDRFAQRDECLTQIPHDAVVTASTYCTTRLSYVDELYDIQYCTEEHILDAEYVVLDVKEQYTMFNQMGTDGKWRFSELCAFLESNGFAVFDEIEGDLIIYRK